MIIDVQKWDSTVVSFVSTRTTMAMHSPSVAKLLRGFTTRPTHTADQYSGCVLEAKEGEHWNLHFYLYIFVEFAGAYMGL